jgi:1-acyl-sn-glycerol-3-phosphate acyltransferase
MEWLRSIVFYAGLSALTLVFTPLSILLFPLPFAWRFRVVSRWAAFNLWSLRVVCGLSFEVRGREHIPAGAAIIMCKHQSAFETLALQLLFPPHVWVLKRELLWIPIYGWGLAAMSPIAIDRASGPRALREIVRQGRQRLAAGIGVVVFPEGTRVAPGARRPYQPGGGLLAAQSGCPVIPVAHNAGYFWPRNSLRKRAGCITMVIGPPIDSRGRDAAEITRLTEQWIEGTVQTLPVPESG